MPPHPRKAAGPELMIVVRPAPGETFPAVTVQRIADLLGEHDYTKPLVFSDGDIRLDIVGGLTFTVYLDGGPLDGLRFTMDVPQLDALPPSIPVKGGAYWLRDPYFQPDFGVTEDPIARTPEGDPVYRWGSS